MFSKHKGIKLETINRRISGKFPKDTFLKSYGSKSLKRNYIYFELNVLKAAKAGLKGKFIALSAYVRKEKKTYNNLSFHFRILEKEE